MDLTFRANARSGRHGWLRLTPAYSLHLVRDILGASSRGDLVLDPFSGTGTTALLSATLGIRAHAVDINPFLVWLGNLKLRRFGEAEVSEAVEAARGLASEPTAPEAWAPPIHQIEKWWDPPALRSLAQLQAGIRSAVVTVPVADLLRVAFCQVLIEHSQASFDHQSMSFRKARLERPQRLAVREAFVSAVENVAASALEHQPFAPAAVLPGDARDLESALPERAYTIVVTSPPYPNRMSYVRELRPYMYWLGYLTDGRQAGELDWQAIGGTWGCATSNLASWEPARGPPIPYPRFPRIVAAIRKDHELLGRYVHKYFEDIQRHIGSLRRVLAPRARCHYVVGNSKFYDTLLPVEEIYCALFEDAGFAHVGFEKIRKRSSKKELYEFVVRAAAPENRVP